MSRERDPAPRYECDQCGLCCRVLEVVIQDVDLEREPRLLPVVTPCRRPASGEPTGEHILAPIDRTPCPLLGTDNRCGIYETRPDVCRTFEPGCDQCRQVRELRGLPPLVPVAD